jgi:hypothetical protein
MRVSSNMVLALAAYHSANEDKVDRRSVLIRHLPRKAVDCIAGLMSVVNGFDPWKTALLCSRDNRIAAPHNHQVLTSLCASFPRRTHIRFPLYGGSRRWRCHGRLVRNNSRAETNRLRSMAWLMRLYRLQVAMLC